MYETSSKFDDTTRKSVGNQVYFLLNLLAPREKLAEEIG